MLIVIPTKNRLKELTNTLNFLNLNKFFFKKIIIVDASNLEIKKKIKKAISNYNLNIKQFLKQTNYGLFNADPVHNMIYTRILLEHDNIIIPYFFQTDSHFVNEEFYLSMSNNDKDILSTIKTYFYYFNAWLPHVIIWKNSNNYFIHPTLIDWLQKYLEIPNKKRFI